MQCSGPKRSCIDAATVQAYRTASYRVTGPDGFVLQVDQASDALRLAQARHGVACSAFITACNPHGRRLDEGENASRQATLARMLAEKGLGVLPAIGEDPTGRWPGEASFLVLGLEREAARRLGAELDQNALLWSGADAVPRLELLR